MYYYQYDSVVHRNLAYAIHIFLKMIGLSPWSLNILTPTNHRKNRKITKDVYQFSHVGSFYNIFLIVIVISMLAHFLFSDTLTEEVSDTLISLKTLTNIQYLGFSTISILIIVHTIRQNKMIFVLNRLKSIDNKLEKCAVFKIDNNSTIHVIIIANIVITCCLIVAHSFYYKMSIVPVHCSPAIVNTWIILQYSMLLDTINKRFKSINSTLIKLGNIRSYGDSSNALFVTKMSLVRGSMLYDVVNIKHAYIRLCEISRQVSEFFGLTTLIAITFIGATSTFVSYFIISKCLKTRHIHDLAVINIISLLWMNIAIMVLTCYVTETINQSNETPIIASTLMDQCAMDEKVEKELDYFLHELSTRKVKFTGCDVIPLDRSLLAMIAGTSMTYLIILIQFRSTA